MTLQLQVERTPQWLRYSVQLALGQQRRTIYP